MTKRAELQVVVGLGQTGLSVIRYLKKRGFAVAVTDSRENPPQLQTLKYEFPEIEFIGGRLAPELLSKAQRLIISPGVSLKEPAIAKQIARGTPAVGDIELFVQAVQTTPIVAITGSNGKTTVTTLMGDIIKHAGYRVEVCGNIGTPVLETLDQQSAPDFYVMELSSFQLETTHSLSAAAAVVLNVSPDHLDRYDNYQEYVRAKQHIYQHCKRPILNADEPEIWQTLTLQNAITFSLQPPRNNNFGVGYVNGQQYLLRGNEPLLATDELKLKGKHHFQNALACLALAEAVGIPLKITLEILKDFTGLKHRCQWVSNKKNIAWYNDSKGTNVGATIAAINTIKSAHKGKIILILGGLSKNADLMPMRQPVAESVAQVILMGQDAPLFEKVLQGVVPLAHVQSMDEAVHTAAGLAHAGDLVLLSPACASFDMFKNFEHRGEMFIQSINNLLE